MAGGLFIFGIIIGAFGMWLWSRNRQQQPAEMSGLARHQQQRQAAKTKALEIILAHATEHGEITNEKVEELTNVSDATATRYLQELEDQGQLTQIGTVGPKVRYRKQ